MWALARDVCCAATRVPPRATGASVYKWAVDDSRASPPLADDPGFLDSLRELDRGLDSLDGHAGDAVPASPQPPAHTRSGSSPDLPPSGDPAGVERRAPAPPPRLGGPRRLPLPPSLIAPFDALLVPEPIVLQPPAPVSPVPQRPLVDLVPPSVEPYDELPHAEPAP